MMPIMRRRGATLTIAYYISAIFQGEVITVGAGKLTCMQGEKRRAVLTLPRVYR